MEVLLRASAEQDTRDEKEAALRVEQVYRQAVMFFLLGSIGASALFGLLAWWLLREQSTSAHLARKAQTDALTGLGNRSYFNDKIQIALKEAQKDKKNIGVYYMDLNGFKQINDTLGHDVGDEVLKEVALRLQKTLRSNDIIARLGGDEFVFALAPTAENNFTLVAERVVNEFDAPMYIKDQVLNVYGSIGICIYPDGGQTIEQLIKKADAAMYKAKSIAKQQKKGAFVFSDTN
jgi:diguanylate cyclase (GGDEF)-like protein